MKGSLRSIGAGLAILALSSSIGQAEPKSGSVTVSVGEVKVKPAGGGAEKALKVDDTVLVGDTVTTGANSRAVIVMTSQSAIRVSENSVAVIEEIKESDTAPKVLVDLKSGSLAALLKTAPATNMDFKIKTPSGIAAARGTFFAVVVENGKGFAQVKEGKIEIVPAKDGAAN